MIRSLLASLSVMLLLGCGKHLEPVGDARPPVPVADDELLRVQDRARYILAAERAAIRATDLLLARKDLDTSKLGLFLTVQRQGAWYALFGRVDVSGAFLVAHAFRAPAGTPQEMEPLEVASLPVDFTPFARAVKVAMERTARAYGRPTINPVIHEEEGGDITVYVMQGTRDPRRFYLGGDVRYRFSADGRTVKDEVPLHQDVFVLDLGDGPNGEQYSGSAHSHVLFAGPLETELAMVMIYPELGSLAVLSPDGGVAYLLESDGSIRVLGVSAKAVLKVLRPDGTFGPPEPSRPSDASPPSDAVTL